MTDRNLWIFGALVGTAGAAIVWAHAGWITALGVILMVWGNTIEIAARKGWK